MQILCYVIKNKKSDKIFNDLTLIPFAFIAFFFRVCIIVDVLLLIGFSVTKEFDTDGLIQHSRAYHFVILPSAHINCAVRVIQNSFAIFFVIVPLTFVNAAFRISVYSNNMFHVLIPFTLKSTSVRILVYSITPLFV